MRGILRRIVQRALNHLGNLGVRNRARAAGAVFIGEPLDPMLHKPSAPFSNRVLMHTEPFCDLLALQALGTQKDHPATVRQ